MARDRGLRGHMVARSSRRRSRRRRWRGDELLKEEVHAQKLDDYSKDELVLMLEHAGFRSIAILGGISDAPATPDVRSSRSLP